jgi:hypothetical protein
VTGAAVVALALAAGTGVASPLIEIASDSSCPSAELVRAALGSVGDAPPQRRAAVAVHDTPNGMLITFRWDGDGPADVRPVAAPPPRDCAHRARAAAVVIASWLGTLPAAPVQAPPQPPRRRFTVNLRQPPGRLHLPPLRRRLRRVGGSVWG